MTPYITLSSEKSFEYTEKRSVFTGFAKPVSSEDDAVSYVSLIRKKYPDAKHIAYAYTVLTDGGLTERFSDDGEPQGTAGKPMLDILHKKSVTNAVVVVSRYFGGILLGAPGLLRAYTSAASGAVDDAGTLKVSVCREIDVEIDYSFYGKVDKIHTSFPVEMKAPSFSDSVSLKYIADVSCADDFLKKLTDAVSGKLKTSVSDPFYYSLLI